MVVVVVVLLFALSAVDGEDNVLVLATGSTAGDNDRVVSIAVSFVDEGDGDGDAGVVVVDAEFDCD